MIFHCYGMLKATKKSISLLQSNRPLIKTIFDCIILSLGTVDVDGSYSMPHNCSGLFTFKG